jgi:hypothetical protein
VREYSDVIYIVWMHDEQIYGMLEKLGAYASMVKYTIDGNEVEELIENDNFTIVDEIVHQHVEESN